jgi:HD-GYP domain-containing protein (c-di-GMP phosphodiesterase class II)
MSLNELIGQSRFVSFDGDSDEVTKGYARISMKNLFPDSGLFYDVYFPVVRPDGKAIMQKMLGKGKAYDPETRKMLTEKGFMHFYVRQEEIGTFENYLQNNAIKRATDPNVSIAEKTQLLYGNAEYIVEKAFTAGQVKEAIPQGVVFAKVAAKQFSQNRVTSEELLKIFSHDYSTFTHSIHVSLLGMAFCFYLGFSEKESADFGLGALFHDIGKSDIDDSILNKPDRLSPEEFAEVKKHPLQGYENLSKLKLLTEDQLLIVLQHHEDSNGKGYPQELQGSNIHKYAKIVRIMDTYDALTTRRSYKDALSPEEAFRIMENEMKDALDEQLLRSFWTFMKIQERPVTHDQDIRFSMEIGSLIQLQLSEKSKRLNAKFIGMDPGYYIIITLPKIEDPKEQFFRERKIVLRYITDGTIFGFESNVIALILQPARLLFLTYPQKIQSCNIRKHNRFDCTYDAHVIVSGVNYQGMITNISMGGCLCIMNRPGDQGPIEINVGDRVNLSFQPLGGRSIDSLPGEVRNIKGLDKRVEIGIVFLDLQEDLRDILMECISNLEMVGKMIS